MYRSKLKALHIRSMRHISEIDLKELKLLRSQTTPHFILSALNTMRSELKKTDKHLKEFINMLAIHLRYAIDTRNEDFVPLEKEFDAAKGFLEVEKFRFGGKVDVEYSIEDAAKDALVPGIVIQPLVGNAVKYARKTAKPPVKVCLNVYCPNKGTVRIEVSNTGRWVEKDKAQECGGFGMENLKQRLDLVYGDRYIVEVIKDQPGWVTVRVDLPVRV